MLLELYITRSDYTAISFYYYLIAKRSFKLTCIKIALRKPLIRSLEILSSEGYLKLLNGQYYLTSYLLLRCLPISLILTEI